MTKKSKEQIRFYDLAAAFDDEVSLMAMAVAEVSGCDRDKIYRDLLTGREYYLVQIEWFLATVDLKKWLVSHKKQKEDDFLNLERKGWKI